MDQIPHSRNQKTSELGSSLIYVMMLMSVAGITFYYQMQRTDNYSAYTVREKQVAFTGELTEATSSTLFCPGGVIRITADSCNKSDSIKLSINQLRNIVYKAQAAYQVVNGKLPSNPYPPNIMPILETRMECYRLQTHINPKTNAPFATALGTPICSGLKGLTYKDLAFPMASNLKGGLDLTLHFEANIATMIGTVLPAINSSLLSAKRNAEKLKSEYDSLYATYENLRRFCEIYKTGTAPGVTPAIAPGTPCPKQAELDAAYAAAQSKLNELNASTGKKNQFETLKNFVELDIINQAPGVLTIKQLAAMQRQGTILRTLINNDTQGSFPYILSRIPSLTQATSIGSGDPRALSEAFDFQLLKFNPACRNDESDPTSDRKKMVFAAQINQDALDKITDTRERNQIQKGLDRALFEGKNSNNGWVDLPLNVVPAHCTLIEDVDPVIN